MIIIFFFQGFFLQNLYEIKYKCSMYTYTVYSVLFEPLITAIQRCPDKETKCKLLTLSSIKLRRKVDLFTVSCGVVYKHLISVRVFSVFLLSWTCLLFTKEVNWEGIWGCSSEK